MPTSWKRLPYDRSCKHTVGPPGRRLTAALCRRALTPGWWPAAAPGSPRPSQSSWVPTTHVPHTVHKPAFNLSDGVLFLWHPCRQVHRWDGSDSACTRVSKCMCFLTPRRGGSSLPPVLGNSFLLRLEALDLGEIPPSAAQGCRVKEGKGTGGQQCGEMPGQSPAVQFATAEVWCVCTLHRCRS